MDAVGDDRELGARVAHAGQVGHDREAKIAFQQRADLGRAVTGRAASAISHRHEVGLDRLQGSGGGAEMLDAGIILGREKFERAQRAPLGKKFREGPVGRHHIPTHTYSLICVKNQSSQSPDVPSVLAFRPWRVRDLFRS
jgi:hypothetical protein